MFGKKRKGYTPQHRQRLKKQCIEEFYKKLNDKTIMNEAPNASQSKNHCDSSIAENFLENEQSSSLIQDVSFSNNVDVDVEMLNVVNVSSNVVHDIHNDVKLQRIVNQEETEQISMFNDDYDDDEDGPNDKLICDSREKIEISQNNQADSDTDEEDESYEKPTSKPDDTNSKDTDKMAEFVEEFLMWCLTSQLSRDNLKALMAMLRKYFNAPLPKDPRTLLKTPKSTKLYEMSNGSYWHYGLKNILNKIINKYEAHKIDVKTIKLSLNIDGAQVGNSSRKGLWIISISDEIFNDVYVLVRIMVKKNRKIQMNF